MPLAFVVLGFGLVAVGLLFALRGVATTAADVDAVKGISVQGPSWLVLVAIGTGVIVFGGWQWREEQSELVPPVESYYVPWVYGDDAALDSLYDQCAAGDMVSCDSLYWSSSSDSEYEWFGLTCGGTDEERVEGGTCAAVES